MVARFLGALIISQNFIRSSATDLYVHDVKMTMHIRIGIVCASSFWQAWNAKSYFLRTRKLFKIAYPFDPVDQDRYFCKQCRSGWDGSYEPSHQDLYCLPFCSWFTSVTLLAVSKYRDGRICFRNSGFREFNEFWKDLRLRAMITQNNRNSWIVIMQWVDGLSEGRGNIQILQ